MHGPSRNEAEQFREIEEHIYLIECLIGRIAALAASTSAKGQLGRAERTRGSLNEGSQVLATLRDLHQRLREKGEGHEAAANAADGPSSVPPDLAG